MIQRHLLFISNDALSLAKIGDNEAQLRIIAKVKLYAFNVIHAIRSRQYYMEESDIDQVISSKVLEAIDHWRPGGCDIKTLATEYIKRALSMECAGRHYYEGFKADVFRMVHKQNKRTDEPILDMQKIRKAVGSDKNYMALRMCFGLDGTPRMSYREIGQLMLNKGGQPVCRQAIHLRKQRAIRNIRRSFTNPNEIISAITG
jgi:hypothetical protein